MERAIEMCEVSDGYLQPLSYVSPPQPTPDTCSPVYCQLMSPDIPSPPPPAPVIPCPPPPAPTSFSTRKTKQRRTNEVARLLVSRRSRSATRTDPHNPLIRGLCGPMQGQSDKILPQLALDGQSDPVLKDSLSRLLAKADVSTRCVSVCVDVSTRCVCCSGTHCVSLCALAVCIRCVVAVSTRCVYSLCVAVSTRCVCCCVYSLCLLTVFVVVSTRCVHSLCVSLCLQESATTALGGCTRCVYSLCLLAVCRCVYSLCLLAVSTRCTRLYTWSRCTCTRAGNDSLRTRAGAVYSVCRCVSSLYSCARYVSPQWSPPRSLRDSHPSQPLALAPCHFFSLHSLLLVSAAHSSLTVRSIVPHGQQS
jgi:hypothetical protein